jgi:phospholipid/cholesterol/gamma-HCH transport system substrate-binding protein
VAIALAVTLAAGVFVGLRTSETVKRTHVIAYFANSNGVYVGDEVRILGIPVGKIDQIQPQGTRVKISFWYDSTNNVPADANAVLLSPSLVPTRAIQLTPAYTGGPKMADDAVIPQERTVVPVEWDDLRKQLEKLTATLQPTEPGGVSTFGALVNTAADNLRGQGTNIRQTIIQMSQALSAFGDHSDDIFSTVKNLSVLVSALQGSTDVIRQLNQHLASTTALLSNYPGEVANAVRDVNSVVGDVRDFVADNRETLGTTSDKLASLTTAVVQSLDDLKQTLHVAPSTAQDFVNLYQPATGAIGGDLVLNMFANPITFICGAIQAASRLNADQSSKLCVQYLAPIVKNRQINFPPLGIDPIVGAMARPNELTYSEDRLRPDYFPPQQTPAAAPSPSTAPALAAEDPGPPPGDASIAAPGAQQTDPANGLQGMMIPPGTGT